MNFYTTQMRSGSAAIAALMLAVAPIPAGCGDEQSTAASAAAKPPVHASAPNRSEVRRCRRSLGDFLDALESLQNSVAVGVSYEGYLAAVNHVRASYAAAGADHLPLLCLARVAGPAEAALNSYIEAANAWGECLAGSSCDSESVEPALQRQWRRAAGRIASAQDGLREVRWAKRLNRCVRPSAAPAPPRSPGRARSCPVRRAGG